MPVVSQITDHRSEIMIIQDHAPLCGLRVVHSNSRRAAMPLAQVDERNWSPVPAVTRVASPSSLSSSGLSQDRAKNFGEKDGPVYQQ